MSSGILALLYLDLHRLANRVRVLVHNPKRLIPWVVFAGWIVFTAYGRWNASSRFQLPPEVGVAAQALASGLLLGLLGYIVYAGPARAPVMFASPADARFLIGSTLPPRFVILWLQLRQVLAYAGSWVIWFVWMLVFLPVAMGPGKAALAIVALALITIALLGLRLPLFVASRRVGGRALRLSGLLLIVLGLASVVVPVLGALRAGGTVVELVQHLAQHAYVYPPGSWLVSAVSGSGLDLLLLLLAAGAVTFVATYVAGDCFPELWESSTRRFVLRKALRNRRGDWRAARRELHADRPRRRVQTRASSSGAHVPSGAWTLFWKEWLGASRVTTGVPAPIWEIALGLAVGVALGVLAHGRPYVVPTALGASGYLLFLIVVNTNVRMGGDLSKSLWWLSAASARSRLGIQTLAHSLVWGLPVGSGALMLGAVGGVLPVAVLGLPTAIAAFWLMRSASLVTYTLLPSTGDMRGPGAFLRFFAFVVPLLPVAGVVLAVYFGGADLGAGSELLLGLTMGVGTAVAAVEGWALTATGARLVRNRGVEFALAERR